MTERTRTRFVAACALVVGLAGSSPAAPVTWNFEGQVRAIQGAIPTTVSTLSSLGVSEGSAFTGQLVFESATPDTDSRTDFGAYAGAVWSLDVVLGSLHVEFGSGDPDNQVIVSVSLSNLTVLGSGTGSSSVFDSPILEFVLSALTPGLYSSDALPLLPPDLTSLEPFGFENPRFGWGTGIVVNGVDAVVFGELTRLEAVPEPALVAFLPLSTVGLVLIRRRQRASSSTLRR